MKKLIIIFLLFASTTFAQGINTGFNFVGISRAGTTVSGVTYSAEASQYFARMTVKPSVDTLLIMAEFIDSLKLCGVWDKLDVLCLLANRDSSSALLNLKQNLYNGVGFGTRTFTPYKGWVGDGTSGYINTNFNIADTSIHFFKHSLATIGLYSNTNKAENKGDMGIIMSSGGVFLALNYGGTIYYDLNNAVAGNNTTNSNSTGLYTISRTASDVTKYYKNSDSIHTSTTNAVIRAGVIFVGARNNGTSAELFSTRQYALYFIGGGLTAQNVIDFNSAVTKLKTKIGF